MDPLYTMIALVFSLVVVILCMSYLMIRMNINLRGIYREVKKSNRRATRVLGMPDNIDSQYRCGSCGSSMSHFDPAETIKIPHDIMAARKAMPRVQS